MNVRELRFIARFTQKEFAAKYKMTKRTIENWECQTRKIAPYVLELLERVVLLDYKDNYTALQLLYSTINKDIQQLDSDIYYNTITIQTGKDKDPYYLYKDKNTTIAVNCKTIELVSESKMLMLLFDK